MENTGIIEHAKPPNFPQRMASLRRWASRESIKTTDTANKTLKARTMTEVMLETPVGVSKKFEYFVIQ